MRLTQAFDYLTTEKIPDATYQGHFYSHLKPCDNLKKLRRKFKKTKTDASR